VRLPRRRALLLLFFVVLVVGAIIFHSIWFTWLGSYLVRDDGPAKADIVVVLGGDFKGTRILKGAELAWEGYAPLVLVSGSGAIYGFHESDLAVNFAESHGYHEQLFVKCKYAAQSTRDEARAVAAELRRRQVRRFLLVTSTFHSHRAASVFQQEAPDLQFRVVTSPDPYFSPGHWWQSREGQKRFFEEWEKTVANWLGL